MKKIINNNSIKSSVVSVDEDIKTFKVEFKPKARASEFRIDAENIVSVSLLEAERMEMEPHYLATGKSIQTLINNYCVSRSFVTNITKSMVNASGIACYSATSASHLNRPAVASNRPDVSAESLQAIAMVNNRLVIADCRACSNERVAGISCDCAHLCFQCLSARYTFSIDFRPFLCCECKKSYLINSPSDYVGFHESWYCGHDFSGVSNLIKNIIAPTHDHVPVDNIQGIGFGAQHTVNELHQCEDGSIEFPNLLDVNAYPYEIPNESSVGSVYGLSGRSKGETLLPIIEYMVDKFKIVLQFIESSKIVEAQNLVDEVVTNVYKSALKVEVAGPKIDDHGNFLPNYYKQRLFYGSAYQLFLICKMLFAGLLRTGSGTKEMNIPTAIGLKVLGCGKSFFSEMFEVDQDDVSDVPSVVLDKLETKILDNKNVVHGDFVKYDWRMRHWLMQLHIQLMMRKFKFAEGSLGIFQKMICSRVCTTLVSKNVLDPTSGQPIFINGLLPSGHYLTALMNSLCNVTMLRFVMLLMNKGVKYSEIVRMIRIKVYGDDWLMVIDKKLKFDIKVFSALMLRLFNMNIPVSDIYECKKIFIDDPITLKSHYPNFLQHGFMKFEYPEGHYHVVFARPMRPIAGAKAFLSSNKALNAKDITKRMVCFAITNGINLENYEIYKCVYQEFFKQSMLYDENCDYHPTSKYEDEDNALDNVDQYIQEKFKTAGIFDDETFKNMMDFPDYELVIQYNLGLKLNYNIRGATTSWADYHKYYESQDNYHALSRRILQ